MLLTDGGEDAPASRQCTHDRDGHDKPPLPDPVSPPGDATKLSPGETVSDSVAADEVRWYAVSARTDETVSVVTTGNPGGISLALFGPDGSALDAIDVATPDRTAFGAPAVDTGRHFVRVSPTDGLGGFFRLTVETAGPDRFDPNDGPGRALPVANGSTTTATLTEGEEDWFAIKLPAGTAVAATVTVEAHALGRDLRVTLFNDAGERIGGEGGSAQTRFHPATGDNRATAGAVAPEAGVYYVRVDCAALDGHAGYRLDVETPTDS